MAGRAGRERQQGSNKRGAGATGSMSRSDVGPDGEIVIELPQGAEDLRTLIEKIRRIECAAAAGSTQHRLSRELLEKLQRHIQPAAPSQHATYSRAAVLRPDVWLLGAQMLFGTA